MLLRTLLVVIAFLTILITSQLSSVYAIAYFPPPLKQIRTGTAPENVTCTEGLELIFKSSNGNPVCVKPQSINKLVERKWGTLTESSKLTSWVWFVPSQCGGPWSKNLTELSEQKSSQLSTDEWLELEGKAIKIYYEEQGIKIYDVKMKMGVEGGICEGCNCKVYDGHAWYLQVDNIHIENMMKLGFRVLNGTP